MYIYIYIYVYMLIEREGERERESIYLSIWAPRDARVLLDLVGGRRRAEGRGEVRLGGRCS